MNRRI